MDGLKQWKCENGHVLGVVQRVKVDGKRWVSRLSLYRQAIDTQANGNMPEVDVIAVVEGTVPDVFCSVCDAVRPWFMGADGLERLLEKLRDRPHRPAGTSPKYPPEADYLGEER